MTTAQVVETSVTVNNNIPIQDHFHPYDQTHSTPKIWLAYDPFAAYFIYYKSLLVLHVTREEGSGVCYFLSFLSVCNCVWVSDIYMFSFLFFFCIFPTYS